MVTVTPLPLPADLCAVLDAPNIAHLATLDTDGFPQASAIWVMRDGDTIIFNTAEGRRKWHNLRRDPRVALSISPADEPYRNWSVQGRVIEMRTSDGVEVIDALSQKYLGEPTFRGLKPGMVRVTVLVAVTRVAAYG